MAYQKVFEYLNEFIQLSESCKIAYTEKARLIHLAKGQVLLEPGMVCRHIYFLAKGIGRVYHFREGKEVTAWIDMAPNIVVSMYSFISQKPAFEYIEILEDSTLFALSYEDLQQLYAEFPEFSTLGRLMLEKYYIALEERVLTYQNLNARQRYENLLKEHPAITQKVSLGYIASYLGITQETLSRIRAKQ